MYFNMWWVRLFIVLLTYIIGDLNISDIKVWKFSNITRHGGHCHNWARHSHHGLNNKQAIQYDSATLKNMEDAIHHENRLRVLAFGAIHVIRSLGLNVKPKSRCRNKRTGFHQLEVNRCNLINIKTRRDAIMIQTSLLVH